MAGFPRSAAVRVPAAVLGACLALLAAAGVMQYGFGIEPCILCLYQRVPYWVGAGGAGLALLPMVGGAARRVLIGLCAVAFLVNAGIAFYNIGVQQHWWENPGCAAPAAAGDVSFDDIAAALARPAERVPCDRVQWSLFGLSLAGYNMIASLALAAACAAAVGRRRWWDGA